jgi:hypothetical protein
MLGEVETSESGPSRRFVAMQQYVGHGGTRTLASRSHGRFIGSFDYNVNTDEVTNATYAQRALVAPHRTSLLPRRQTQLRSPSLAMAAATKTPSSSKTL